MSIINTKEVHLAAYVEAGEELTINNFKKATTTLDPAALPDGQVLLKVLYIGLDASLKYVFFLYFYFILLFLLLKCILELILSQAPHGQNWFYDSSFASP